MFFLESTIFLNCSLFTQEKKNHCTVPDQQGLPDLQGSCKLGLLRPAQLGQHQFGLVGLRLLCHWMMSRVIWAVDQRFGTHWIWLPNWSHACSLGYLAPSCASQDIQVGKCHLHSLCEGLTQQSMITIINDDLATSIHLTYYVYIHFMYTASSKLTVYTHVKYIYMYIYIYIHRE